MSDRQEAAPLAPAPSERRWVANLLWVAVSACLLLLVAGNYIVFERQASGAFFSDLPAHLDIARALSNQTVVHPLFHLFILATAQMAGTDLESAAPALLVVLQLMALASLAALLYFRISGAYRIQTSLLIAMVALVASAIYVPAFSPNIYLGQGGINILHSPTLITTRVFSFLSVLTFWLLLESHPKEERRRAIALTVATCVLLLLGMLAKPSFGLAFIAAAPFVIVLARILDRGRPVPWVLASLPVLVVLAVLAAQTLILYGTSEAGNVKIAIDWFLVAGHRSTSPLFSGLLLSAFPLATIALFPHLLRDRLVLLLASLFLVSMLQYFALAELGGRTWDENFSWGRAVVLPVFFVVCVAQLIKLARSSSGPNVRGRLVVLGVILIAHLGSGLIYWQHMLTSNMYW